MRDKVEVSILYEVRAYGERKNYEMFEDVCDDVRDTITRELINENGMATFVLSKRIMEML